jgi:hypothetical protein
MLRPPYLPLLHLPLPTPQVTYHMASPTRVFLDMFVPDDYRSSPQNYSSPTGELLYTTNK